MQETFVYKMGDDLFADQTQDEFAATNLGIQLETLWSEFPRLGTREYSGVALASSVCWTTKDVALCFFCWRRGWRTEMSFVVVMRHPCVPF